ncbi:MAG: 2-amino-4-hydroxy-6-hydroxymethyldihydropteridine diphosphokinase [Burkholderiales bacterium]|nr:2-amino-4-hydroxy-6-hydroxymethyldihydropteridine diphosphokinase [Burkholderiales bacterium]
MSGGAPARRRPASRRARELPEPVIAYIALGGNLDGPAARIRRALAELARLPHTRLVRASALYRNPAVGGPRQPDFVNAVAKIATRLAPRELLERLLEIEARHGRTRSVPNAPRTLDLDLALYGDAVIDEPGLTVPHPRLAERAFVLVPLAEIAPGARVPGRGCAAGLAALLDARGMERLEDGPRRPGPNAG